MASFRPVPDSDLAAGETPTSRTTTVPQTAPTPHQSGVRLTPEEEAARYGVTAPSEPETPYEPTQAEWDEYGEWLSDHGNEPVLRTATD